MGQHRHVSLVERNISSALLWPALVFILRQTDNVCIFNGLAQGIQVSQRSYQSRQ